MRIAFCFSGKTFKGPIFDLVKEYKDRVSRYTPVELIEAKTLKLQSRPGFHIILTPDAKSMTSEAFASLIGDHLLRGTKNLFFYTGGPAGYEPGLIDAANLKISFSTMTFNHQLIRIMLLEQVYRAFTIIHGEPYHK